MYVGGGRLEASAGQITGGGLQGGSGDSGGHGGSGDSGGHGVQETRDATVKPGAWMAMAD